MIVDTRGANTKAPDPNPAIVIPEAIPLRSGNHLISTYIGGV